LEISHICSEQNLPAASGVIEGVAVGCSSTMLSSVKENSEAWKISLLAITMASMQSRPGNDINMPGWDEDPTVN
jgi:hypothetical protein